MHRLHSPSPDNLVLVVKPRRLTHGLHYLQYAHPFPLPKVVRLVPGRVRTVVEYLGIRSERLQREKVAPGEVDYMEIIADTCTVALGSNQLI